MWDAIIVGAIGLAGAAYAVGRLFARPACGCCAECGCSSMKRPDHRHAASCSGGTGCACGK